jgi:curved DNA-binding protein CbpA
MVDYYEVLELDNNASLVEIRESFRNLALRYHPDRNKAPNAAEKFIKIVEAYEDLCDEKGETPHDFAGLLIKPGKVIIGPPDELSLVKVTQGDAFFLWNIEDLSK